MVETMGDLPCGTTLNRQGDSGGGARAYGVTLDGRVRQHTHQSQTGCTKRTGAVPPRPEVTFYVKSDRIKDGMGDVLIQEDDSEEDQAAEAEEHARGGASSTG